VTSEGGLDLGCGNFLREARGGHDGGLWRSNRECLRSWRGTLVLSVLMSLLLLFNRCDGYRDRGWDWSRNKMRLVVEVVGVGRRES
jgi:hypothetical protein